LLAGFQISRALGFRAHALDRVHHVGFLREEGVPQIRCPRDIVSQLLDYRRERRHGLDTWVPVLLFHRIGQRLVLQVLILSQPLLQLNDFQRIGGSHQRLA